MTDPESAVECQPGFGRATRCPACGDHVARGASCPECEPDGDSRSGTGEAS